MSQRNRSGRGLNRNNGSSHGEEAALWDTLKDKLPEVLAKINEDGRNLEELLKLDAEASAYRKRKGTPASLIAKMDAHCRKGVKATEAMKLEIPAYVEKINILRAILQANKDQGSDSAETGSAERSGSVTAGNGGSAAAAAAAAQAKSKVVFAKGDEVAFRPKQVTGGEQPDWILGEVAAVIGDGKTRRYKVMDVEPDEPSPWESGKIVLALYPQTTTFYKAEVVSTSVDGKVNLHFEGENDSATLQQVERRFVVDFRQ
ncbi:unnamed protein product [Parascedosporium putredinis]|uniref:SGF29 C-terminal domain-containing protein n=1 Tax=Parascedosporium putredinis TaxID=1442378 RepID=A0A9P1GY97_9PEZI|nr:unnamed protein product [Parascedosporium putredinis]CAI7989948.1 unnamed protein product [Parascedosporium putredinis]